MEKQQIIKISNYLNISQKAGYVIFGADNFKTYKQKMYLILVRKDAGKSLYKQASMMAIKTGSQLFEIEVDIFKEITKSENCKLIGIKNKGLSEQIIKLLEV